MQEMSAMMQQFEKESTKMEMSGEMMDDVLDDVLGKQKLGVPSSQPLTPGPSSILLTCYVILQLVYNPL